VKSTESFPATEHESRETHESSVRFTRLAEGEATGDECDQS